MRPDPLADDDSLIECCPHCESSRFRSRSGKHGDPDVEPGTYRCVDCREVFGAPDRREPKAEVSESAGGYPESVKALIEMDPDDWPPEDQELVSDGGVSWTDLTAFQRECLWALRELEGDSSIMGLDVKDALDARYGEDINHGRLYPNLDRLVEYGLVAKGRIDDRTNSYELTPAGVELLVDESLRQQEVLEGQAKRSARSSMTAETKSEVRADIRTLIESVARDGSEDLVDWEVKRICYCLTGEKPTGSATSARWQVVDAIDDLETPDESYIHPPFSKAQLEGIRDELVEAAEDGEAVLATDGAGPDWSPYRAANGAMEEVSFRAPSEMLEEIDERIEAGEFKSRSEAIRQAVNDLLSRPKMLRTDGGEAGKKKTIQAYAVVDWKKGNIRTRQTKPKVSELGNNELLANLRFDVHIPDVDVPTLAAEIDVPEPMVYSATLEALEDRELPDYALTADSVITEHVDALQDAEPGDLEGLIDTIVVRTLRETRGRPRLELVEEYVNEVVGEIRNEQ